MILKDMIHINGLKAFDDALSSHYCPITARVLSETRQLQLKGCEYAYKGKGITRLPNLFLHPGM